MHPCILFHLSNLFQSCCSQKKIQASRIAIYLVWNWVGLFNNRHISIVVALEVATEALMELSDSTWDTFIEDTFNAQREGNNDLTK